MLTTSLALRATDDCAQIPDDAAFRSVPHPRETLLRQARVARRLGSPFVAHVLEAAYRQLDAAPRLAAMVDGWPGDPDAAALAMRLNSALHALARRGCDGALATLYRDGHGDFDAVVAQALAGAEPFLLAWLAHPTQTNEVGRAAAFMAALMHIGSGTGPDGAAMPCELLELGASAGLNLNLARYRYALGGQRCGPRNAPVSVSPRWRGPPPRIGPVEVVAARGVDLNPVDLTQADARERMMAYVWRGEVRRARRLASAIAMARRHPPQVDRGHAAGWLDARLAEPQAAGVRRVVLHSMVMQYLSATERRAVLARLAQAGSRATAERPLAWIALEWNAARTEVVLRVTHWQGDGRGDGLGEGTTQAIAACHPYGKWIEWRA